MGKDTPWIKLFFIAAIAAALFACSSGNSDVSPFDNSHSNYALGTFSAAGTHGPLAKAALQDCQSCHATPKYGPDPRFDVLHTNIPRGCETCHQDLTAHPTPWLPGRIGTPSFVANTTSHATAGNLATACALCHEVSKLDVVRGSGNAPSCWSSNPVGGIACHTASSPVQKSSGCTSCHADSPGGPDGAAWPNRNFAHNKHAQGLSLACAACHDSSTSGMASHANLTADVPLSSTYQAKTVTTFSYNANDRTCSGVSCHGGKTTPAWQATGSITFDDSTKCGMCHESGTAQYNSYYSGKHQSHMTGTANTIYRLSNPSDIACTDCHNLANLAAQHFIGLDTQGYGANDQPRNTVGGAGTKLTAQDYVGPTNTTTCATTACHVSGRRGWFE